jgi:uncharacterized protein YndB with AHSA1/START domain
VGVAAASAVIEAPIELVWDVMLDTERYPEWNPFIVRVRLPADRVPQVGDRLVLHVRWSTGGRARATERITTLVPPSDTGGRRAQLEYAYGGPVGALRLVRGRRLQELVRLDAGLTTYTTHERLHGPLAALAPLVRVQDGFERHARALKARAESLC